jgi:hypothetical protein
MFSMPVSHETMIQANATGFSVFAGRVKCTACPRSKYQAHAGQVSCINCGLEMYENSEGSAACVAGASEKILLTAREEQALAGEGDGGVCPAPPLLVNGQITHISMDGVVGGVATYLCNPGFTHRGSLSLACQPDSTWSKPWPACVTSSDGVGATTAPPALAASRIYKPESGADGVGGGW